ncbi:unnamed protein product [Ceutorhynchus assimilis]|uniref:Ubiquitin-protein ligase E3A n=1 Tax=Ceutorhynchus assimilis TaxID=467358 RepID=A0A9N9QQC3_9CUCU|nr:unnamed protein product [Ceutorhynchus assimilis]
MNPSDTSTTDDASSNPEASSSAEEKIAAEDEMKRAAAKKLIERYFYQLTEGCGNPNCGNKDCASSGKLNPMSPNDAAGHALKLFSEDAKLCESHPSKIARINLSSSCHEKSEQKSCADCNNVTPSNDNVVSQSSKDSGKSNPRYNSAPVPTFLTEQSLYDIIDECETNDCYSPLIRTLGEIFSSIENLAKSFAQEPFTPPSTSPNVENPDKILNKEELRHLEGEKDKDEDSSAAESSSSAIQPVDLSSVRRAYTALFKLKTSIFENSLVNALVTLAGNLQMELPIRGEKGNYDDIINVLLIVFEIPALGSGDFLETALPAICRASQWLPIEGQASLARMWAGPGRTAIRNILENLQQLVTLRVIVTPFHHDFFIQDENVITSATKLMKILYYANMLAGVLESPSLRNMDDMSDSMDESCWSVKLSKSVSPQDPLGLMLGVHVLDCRKPFLPYVEFYNEPLSDMVEMDRDFANFKSELGIFSGRFSFMNYPFILTPATKTMGLYFDNRIRMYSERRISILQAVTGQPSNPYLRVKVRRENIIDDALVELEMISMENPNDLKKQLVVEFEGEQGIDEGGVSKEFFQLVIEEIFNPDYAMFTLESETQTVWFNPTSFESTAQFTLIGIVLGLAIYNNIILAVNFPMVLYRKLMGKKGSFEDLVDWNPVLYNSLKQMLEYSQPDLEETFMQTFRISYQDVFGSIINYDLKDKGDKIAVTQENKYEFVDLYADFLLNKAVEKQFKAFYKGFQMVVDESPLEQLFRPEEIELLICGSKNFDFDELENSTEYDGGYTHNSQVVKDFWLVVHAFSIEDKRKLLQFTTGSDRVPIGGLSRLKLVIAKNGPDSDRLPTAHTCFNVLLLPEYSSKEKLKDRLVKAINYSKGFGML